MIEYAVRTRLLAVSAVTDIVGQRVTVMHLEQEQRFPAITLQLISGAPEYDLDGVAGVADARIQVDCWVHQNQRADPYDTCRDLGEAVRAALSAFTGTVDTFDIQSCFLINRRALHDDDAGIYRESQDWAVGYAES